MPLTGSQLQILAIVEQLGAESVALGGGAALIDAGLVDRPTQDLDFFSNDLDAIAPFAEDLVARLRERGSDVEILRQSAGFVQLITEGVLVDIAHNYLADPPVQGSLGLRCADSDIVGGKLEALFTRRVNRDVIDVAQLLDRYTIGQLIGFAKNRDAGFDVAITIEMTAGNDYDARQGFTEQDFETAKSKVLDHLRNASPS